MSGRSIFNGGTVSRRRPLQQGKFEGYGSQWYIRYTTVPLEILSDQYLCAENYEQTGVYGSVHCTA